MITAHSLEGLDVRTELGEKIGCLHDLRVTRDGRVTHLVYGRRGLLERLGFRGEKFDTIPWSQVVEIRARDIIVSIGVNGRKRAHPGPA
jgi:sporulation protein YlmC with PRC-barrel domain